MINAGVGFCHGNIDRPDSDTFKQPLQASPAFLCVSTNDQSDQEFANHRAAGSKNVPLTTLLLNPIAHHGDTADCFAEVISVEQVALHADSPICLRTCSLASFRCLAMANRIDSSSSGRLSAHNW